MSEVEEFGDFGRRSWRYQPEVGAGYEQGTVRVDLMGYESTTDITPGQAREMAAALLVAADEAERVGRDDPLQGPPRPPSELERAFVRLWERTLADQLSTATLLFGDGSR